MVQRGMRPRGPDRRGLRLISNFVTPDEHAAVLAWLGTLHPLWERKLQRPVYWLGSWQFACLGYYHPPRGIVDRCVDAEPFPPVLAGWVARIEQTVRSQFPASFIPDGWHLDTCLVNFYGDRITDGRREDRARVGTHRDFEPGPVASVSIGERAMFQFTTPRGAVVDQMWLEDRSLQLFAGPRFKDQLFHRVQRVERKAGHDLPPAMDGFRIRRVNFTLRHVPRSAVVPFAAMDTSNREAVRDYVETLARHAPHWAASLGAP
jgi:DNA oxidative demethylase